MGLSLRNIGRKIWETATPQNEEALRRAEANLQRSNQVIQQANNFKYGQLAQQPARQQFIQQNQPVRFNAPKVYAQEAGNTALNTFAGGIKRFGQSVASAGLSPVSNYYADRERERANRLLKPSYENLYRAYGADPRLGANQAEIEAEQADYAIRTDPLNRSNIGVNDSLATTARKVGAQGLEAGLDIATAGTGPVAFKAGKLGKTVKPSIFAGAGLGAAGNVAYTAQQEGANIGDYAKSAAMGGAIGGVIPAVGGAAGKVGKAKPKITPKTPLDPKTQQKRNGLINAYTTALDKNRPDLAAGIAKQIDAIDSPKPRLKKLNQEGFISLGDPKKDAVIANIEKNLTKLKALDAEQAKLDKRLTKGSRSFVDGGLPSSDPRVLLKAVDTQYAPKSGILTKLDERGSIQLPGGKSKPKVSLKQSPVDSSPKSSTKFKARTADEAIREIAALGGENIGESKVGLGLTGKAISTATGGKFTTTRGLNPFRAASEAASKAYTDAAEEAITGTGAGVTNKARAVFAGTGLANETKQIARVRHGQYANIKDVMTRLHKRADDIQAQFGDDTRELLDRTIRDNKYTQKIYGEAPRKIESLPPELQSLVKEKMAQNKIVNDINRQLGIIDEKVWKGGTKGQHIARVFNIPKQEREMMRENLTSMLETQAGIKRKDISKIADETLELLEKDPIRAIDLRMEMALRNQVFTEAMDSYADRGFIKKKAPNDSYIQVHGNKWGKYDGQFVERGILEEITDNRIFKNDMMASYDRLVNSYKGSLIGTSDRLQKAFKTTMAPGTIVGNIFSNPMIFNIGAGTNPLTQMADMIGAARKMTKGISDADVYKARQLGVIGGDTGKLLTGSSSEQLAIGKAKNNIAKRALDKFGRFYGNIDDTAKMGLWTRLQKQGMSPQDAALEVAKFTQDYNNVGRTITLIADTPVLGKPFARFSPELVRIIKNNVTRAPHRIIAGIAALAYISNKMSQDSGETPEERAAREGAVGQTKIPGTAWINQLMGGPDDNISLNLAAGDTSINIARSMGLNFPIEPGTDPNRALVEQLLPFEIPVTKDALGNDKFDPTKVVTSMTLRPGIEQLFDRNFMGRRVSDPTNQAYDSQGNVMKYTDLSKKDQIANRLRAAAISTLPLGNEIDSLVSSAMGKPTALGKERSLPQAALRTIGIKTEANDKAARQKRADTAEYFNTTKKAEQDFLNQNKDLEELYFKVFPKTKDRNTGLKISDQITPEKWARVQSDTSGRLYNFMRSQALEANKRDGQPIDPVFNLPTKEQQRQVLELRSKPTGEDIEMDNILEATQGWYRAFKKAESQYYKDSTSYYSGKDLPDTQNQRAKDYAAVKWPEQPSLIGQYYATKENNPEAAKAMFKTTNLSDEFDRYKKMKLDYYNAKRKIEGYPPISESTFNNVTFGYEDDERKVFNELKYSKGYGGYGGYGSGGGRAKSTGSAYKYAVSLNAGGKFKAPKVSVKSYKTPSKKVAISKPKVTLKKSMV